MKKLFILLWSLVCFLISTNAQAWTEPQQRPYPQNFIVLNNVGIGTTAPTQKLTLVGNQYFNTTNPTIYWDGNILNLSTTANVAPVVAIRGVASYGGRLDIYDEGDDAVAVSIQGKVNENSYFNNGGNVGIGMTTPAAKFVVSPPASETIAAAATITVDGCGTLKQITSAGAVTTNTTNTFTAPAAANTGCCMDVVNVGANNITLDNNANFYSAGAADVVLTANDSVRVCSNGTAWYQIGSTGVN